MTESLTQWTNWVGNRRCTPKQRRSPNSVDDVRSAVLAARDAGERVRVVASGHSYTDICTTDGTLIEMQDFAGITDISPDARRGQPRADPRPARRLRRERE